MNGEKDKAGRRDREKICNFKDLEIWQRGLELATRVYSITRSFPREKRYGLTSQMRRASVSVSANIAEGFSRKGNRDYGRFLYIALGSLSELETHFHIAALLAYLTSPTAEEIIGEIDQLQRMTRSLIKRLEVKTD